MGIARLVLAVALSASATTLALAQTQSAPSSQPSPNASATPAYNFVYRATPSPGATPFPVPGAPSIDEIDLSDDTLVPPTIVRARVLTNIYVSTMTAETFGQVLAIPRVRPGVFALEASITDVPGYLRNHSFNVTFTASVTDGRTATITLPLSIR